MIRRPPRSTLSSSSAASDVYKRQYQRRVREKRPLAMSRLLILAIVSLLLVSIASAQDYVLGQQGDNCASTCGILGRICLDSFDTGNTTALFAQAGVTCPAQSAQDGVWWSPDQPSYVTEKTDPNYGQCLGYKNVPAHLLCQGSYPSVRRLCHCGQDDSSALTFGTGLSAGTISTTETTIFAHKVADGHVGVMNHFWSTCSPAAEAGAIIRYYVDGEQNASIAFSPAMASGTGYDDGQAPWGTKWIGLGAGKGQGQAWFNNFKIPFGKSIRVTAQHRTGSFGGFFMIVRGGLDIPLSIGETLLPKTARLQLQVFEGSLAPMEFMDIVSIPKGHSGQFFMSTLAVDNSGVGGLNFLEGCFHMYDPVDQPFPGTVLSTGTEDYFDSGWYFNAGEFRLPVSGFTHLLSNQSKTEWSAYRFHEMDPLRFADGFRLQWRCGDLDDVHTGLKCYTETGGAAVGTPTCDNVRSYGWVYVWPNGSELH
eukprot:TRINITY_DN7822_c0_g1_i3.p1 TRINITY_DN7822_c0_g1~~TRINITY_DN7822_c0_g1_i3.p1  ORF type:complete len:480 (-),score=120.61 TRINITY_DN7822_c0_g1_i3:112-1551(-)